MIFNFSIVQVHFVFCWLNFIVHFTYLIKCYNVMFAIVVFRFSCYRPAGLRFFRAGITSFYTHSTLLTFLACFIVLFHYCCSHARVLILQILVHEFPISYSHT